MEHNNNDEVDLFQLLNKLKGVVNSWIVSLFKAIDFIYKSKYIILILVIIGVGLGFFSQKSSKPDQLATALIRINFDSVDYVYTEIELLNGKLKEKDSLFFMKNGFRGDTLEMKEIEIRPIINLKDILEKYELNDRKLEGLLKNLDFDEDDLKLYETFNSEYKYHILDITLSHVANKQTINKTINYLNDNELLQQIKKSVIKDINNQIENNTKSISQINHVIDTYQTNESLASPSDQIYVVDKNFSMHVLFEKKIELQTINESLKKFLVYSKDIVVLVNKPNIIVEKTSILGNKLISYPILLVLVFLLLAFFRYVFMKLKKIAKETKG